MNNELVQLNAWDLSLAAVLVIALAGLSVRQQLGLARDTLIAAGRMVAQLLLIGLVLKVVFTLSNPIWIALISLIMVVAAGREVMARQQRQLAGWWRFSIGTSAMFISSFVVTLFGLTALIQADPWYSPQYAIPVLGMLLGNTMNGVALAQDRLTQSVWQRRTVLEQRLMLGETPVEAISDLKRESLRGGFIPIVNAMAIAGIVSLPGMMTGQILAGSPPVEAVKYQILIWLLIAAGSGFGMILAVELTIRRLFDERERLRLDRLTGKNS